MRKFKLEQFLSDNQLKERLYLAKTRTEFRRWQCIYIVQTQEGITAESLADILGISKPSVYSYIQKYNKSGIEGILPKKRGGRKRAYLSLNKEAGLLKNLEKRVINKGMMPAKEIKQWIEEKIGHAVSDDFISDLFKRNYWKKKKIRERQVQLMSSGKIKKRDMIKTTWVPKA